MKNILFVLLFVSTSTFGDPWTREDTQREAVFFGLRTFTYLQTYTVAKDGWKNGLYEQNKLLGKYPHQDRVTAYFAINSLAHLGVAYILPAEWRKGFQYVTIGEVGAAAINNHANGIRVMFPI